MSDDVRQKLKALMEQKAINERALREAISCLSATGLGMSESLIDKEGYPKANYDLTTIRENRALINSNDFF